MRLAILVAGPIRYVDYVLNSIESSTIDFDIFVYLWIEEKGNKKRSRTIANYDTILSIENVEKVVFSKPLDETMINKKFGQKSNSNSRVYNTVSMFMSLSEIMEVVKSVHREKRYSHVLRLRTDQAVNKSLMPLVESCMKDMTFTTSFNPKIPETWVSDHIILAPFNQFINIFSWENLADLKYWYAKSNRNPEALIARKMVKSDLQQSRVFRRGSHYEIVYSDMIEKVSLDTYYNNFYNKSIDDSTELKSVKMSLVSKIKRWILQQPR